MVFSASGEMRLWRRVLADNVRRVSSESPLERELVLALARRLRDLRDGAGLTQEKAAERAGLSRNHHQLLESGLSDRAKKTPANPRLSTLLDIAKALDCDATDLVAVFTRDRRRSPA